MTTDLTKESFGKQISLTKLVKMVMLEQRLRKTVLLFICNVSLQCFWEQSSESCSKQAALCVVNYGNVATAS